MKKYLILLTALVIAATLTISPASAAVETLDLGWDAAPEQPEALDALPAPEADTATKVAYTDDNIVGGSIYYNPQNGEIVDCDEKVISCVIPSEIDGVTITRIGKNAFQSCDVLKVTIPDTVTYIGSYAFWLADLQSLVVPESVTEIGEYAFSTCSQLKAAEIKGTCNLGSNVFGNCNILETVSIPHVTSIGDHGFWNCFALYDITLPEGLNTIADYTFCSCNSLKTINFPSSLKVIGSNAFAKSGLEGKLVIPDNVTEIGTAAFDHCEKIVEIEIPGSVKSIPESMLSDGLALRNIVIKEGVTSIGKNAFYKYFSCESTLNLYIPSSVEYILEGAFQYYGNKSIPVENLYYGACKTKFDSLLIGSKNETIINAVNFYAYNGAGYEHYEDYAFDDDSHWKICRDCKTVLGEKSPHTPDGSGVCTVCGHGKQPEHVHTETYGTDTHVHWTKCDVCGESWGVEEHVLGEDGVCEICRFKPEQESTGSGIRGDLNSDGDVTVSDGVTMQRILAGLE